MTGAAPSHGCLSELELDRLLAGDDDPALRQRAEACERCRRRLAELSAQRDARMTRAHVSAQAAAIMAQLGAPALAPAPLRTRWRTWWLGPPAILMAAALAALVLWPRHPAIDRSEAPRDEIHIKGRARFEVVRVEPGPPRVMADGEPLAAGATLSFRVACPAGCWAVLFAGSGGRVTPLADQVAPPWRIAAGAPVQLPVSVTLDDTAGDDRVLAVLCVRDPDITALRAALAQAPAAAIAGCEVRAHRIAGRREAP